MTWDQLYYSSDGTDSCGSYEDGERECEAAAYASVMKVMPVREMVKKGWLPGYDSSSGLVKEAARFWAVKDGDAILDELGDEAESEKQKAADALAGKCLKSQEILDFAEPFKQYFSRERIERCAAELGLHPGIVVGRL